MSYMDLSPGSCNVAPHLQYSSIHVDCRVCGGVTSTSVPQACLLTFQRVWGGGSNTFLPQSGGRSK